MTSEIAKILVLFLLGSAALTTDAAAQANSKGAAEKSGKGWPYPEAAQRGATGFSPDYSAYDQVSERWDIYVNILWRKAGARSKPDLEYFDYELGQFLDSLPGDQRLKITKANHLLLLVEQIRGNSLKLPHRDAATGCLLFMVKHDNRSNLAADDCNKN